MHKLYRFFVILCSITMLNISISKANDCVFYLHGTCYDCNTPYNLKVGTKDSCELKCPNRIFMLRDRTCRLKIGENKPFPSSSDTSTNKKNCQLEEGESDKVGEDFVETYFRGKNGKCYPCNTTEAVNVISCDEEKRFCHKNCSGRISKKYNSNDMLYSVKKCPKDRPLMDRFMMCWTCSEPTPLDLSFDTSFQDRFCKNIRHFELITNRGVFNIEKTPYSYLGNN